MSVPLSPSSLLFVAGVVVVAGGVNGIAGFGFAVIGTMALATTLDPATAVAFMILPILAVNARLVGELSVDEFRTCGRRFAPLLVAATVGTVLGMALLDRIPEAPLRIGLGIVTLGFVATAQRIVPLSIPARLTTGRSAETSGAMVTIGGLSGLLFGATNVGVQLVAYLRSRGLDHELFIGVVALVFFGINGVRVVAAGVLGLYADATVLVVSLAAMLPAAAGVALGQRLRPRIAERAKRGFVLGLLILIGVRLVAGGLGIA